jgi:hypothetical protein
VHAPKGQAPKPTAQGGSKSHAPGAKSTQRGSHSKPAASTGQTPKSGTTKSSVRSKETAAAKTAITTTGTQTGTTQTLSKVQQKLQQNTRLASKLESRLPRGTDLMTAAEGFRNLGQFVAAVNVSSNLGLDFDQLKTAMVDDGMSLGQAIKDQRSSLDGTTEATRAQRDADALVKSTETVATTSTTSSTSTAKPRKPRDGRR